MRSDTAKFAWVQGSMYMCQAVLAGYAVRYLLAAGLTNTQAGLSMALATGISLVAQPVLTALVDKRKMTLRQVMLLLTCVLTALSWMLPLLRSRMWIVIAYILISSAKSMAPAFVNAMGMTAIGNGQAINFGATRGAGSIFYGVGAQIANILVAAWGIQTIPVFGGALALVMMISCLRFPGGEPAKKERPSGGIEFLRSNPRFTVVLIGAVLLSLGNNATGSSMYQIAVHKGNADAQGTALLVMAWVELPVMFLFTKMLRWERCDIWFRISGIFMAVRLLLIWLLPGPGGFILAQVAQMPGYGLYAISSVFYASSVVEKKDTVKAQTYMSMSGLVAGILSNVCTGVVIDTMGIEVLMALATGIAFAGAMVIVFSAQRVEQILAK